MRLTLEFLPTPHDATLLDTVIVIDVLRMTTTACALFSQGLSELAVVAAVDDARALAAAEGALLLGERGGVKLPGFDGGNSPLEYLNRDLTKRRAVLCTSNGSSAVEAAGASHLFLGSVVNAAAVAAAALSVAQEELRLVCAGTNGEISLDDVLGAACIVREVARLEPDITRSDGVNVVLKALSSTPDLAVGLSEARHGALLHSLGFGEDVRFAARLNSLEKVPRRASQGPARFTS